MSIMTILFEKEPVLCETKIKRSINGDVPRTVIVMKPGVTSHQDIVTLAFNKFSPMSFKGNKINCPECIEHGIEWTDQPIKLLILK